MDGFTQDKTEYMESKENDFTPFGEEWKKEVIKLPKPFLINMWAKSAKEAKELLEQRNELLTSLKDLLNANPNDGSWNFPAASSRARELIQKLESNGK